MPSALWQRAQWRIRITDRTVTTAAVRTMAMDRAFTAPAMAVVGAGAVRPIMAGGDPVIMAVVGAIAVVGAEAARTTEVAVGVVEVVGIMGVVVDANVLS